MIALMFAVGLPAAYVILMRLRGEIDRLFVRSGPGRVKPLRASAVSCLAGWLALTFVDGPTLFEGLMLCCATNAALAAVYTIKWRLSLHSVGAWGAQAAALVVVGHAACVLLPLVLAVSWSRLALQEHSVSEVVAGALVGSGSTWLILTRWLALPGIGGSG